MSEGESELQSDVDLERRFLCSDGNCIGIIGRSGDCKVCGQPIDSSERAAFEAAFGALERAPERATDAAHAEAPETAPKPAESDGPDLMAEVEPSRDASFDLEDRVLCPDGVCTGIIGPSGKCNECGMPLAAADEHEA